MEGSADTQHYGTLAAFALFGLGSWIAVNGVYQQLPIIAQTAPEGYDLFSYAAIAISCSNIIPAAYVAMAVRLNTAQRSSADKVAIIGVVGGGGIACCLLLSAYWDQTMTLAGASHSVLLIGLIFAVGGIDCLTSLLFYPVLVGFPGNCVSALQLGETMTGLIAAIMAAIQSTSPGFTVSSFFIALAGLMMLSTLGYCYIDHIRTHHPITEQPQNTEHSVLQGNSSPVTLSVIEKDQSVSEVEDEYGEDLAQSPQDEQDSMRLTGVQAPDSPTKPPLEDGTLQWKLLIAQGVLSFVENGLHTTVLPYSLSGHADTDTLVSVAVKVGYGSAALTTILAHFKAPTLENSRTWFMLYVVSYMCGIWMLIAATHHVGDQHGVFNTIVAITCKAVVAFTKTSLFIGAQRCAESERMLRSCGIGVQIGSLVGSSLFFVLSVPLECFHKT